MSKEKVGVPGPDFKVGNDTSHLSNARAVASSGLVSSEVRVGWHTQIPVATPNSGGKPTKPN